MKMKALSIRQPWAWLFEHQEKIVAMADSLKKNPYHKNTIKMKGFENRHRLKEGQFRVIYSVYKKQLIVDILDAGFRQGVYKK